jgi:hypothetical protein
MKVLTEGHFYELDSMDGSFPQRIQFIEKVLGVDGKSFVTLNDGTTNEEVLDVLIDRMEIMYAKLPNQETELALGNLRTASELLKIRTRKRVEQGVESTNLDHVS